MWLQGGGSVSAEEGRRKKGDAHSDYRVYDVDEEEYRDKTDVDLAVAAAEGCKVRKGLI